jgi:sodium-dependent dicarboxylate transporter 2/3/5
MLPVATPPNAIVFASRRVGVAQMAKAGFALNLVAIVVISLWVNAAGGALGAAAPR